MSRARRPAGAADHERGAVGDAAADVVVDAPALGLRGERADPRGLVGGGRRRRTRGRGPQLPDHGLLERFGYEHPYVGAAGLTGVGPRRSSQAAGDGGVEVGLGRMMMGGLAAQFERPA